MNKVILMGRLTKDPVVRYSQGQQSTAIARYTLAVNRKFKDKDGNYTADFIGCVAFGRAGEFAEKYFRKGMQVAIVGRVQTGSYTDKNGNKVYSTDIVIEEQDFADSARGGSSAPQQAPEGPSDGFMDIPEGIDEELPFS